RTEAGSFSDVRGAAPHMSGAAAVAARYAARAGLGGALTTTLPRSTTRSTASTTRGSHCVPAKSTGEHLRFSPVGPLSDILRPALPGGAEVVRPLEPRPAPSPTSAVAAPAHVGCAGGCRSLRGACWPWGCAHDDVAALDHTHHR